MFWNYLSSLLKENTEVKRKLPCLFAHCGRVALYSLLFKICLVLAQVSQAPGEPWTCFCITISSIALGKYKTLYCMGIYLFLRSWAVGILRILQSDWFRERAVFSYLLTTVMVTNYAKRRVKLRIERAKFQFVLIVFCNRAVLLLNFLIKKQWILTKAITVMSFVDTLMRQCVK